MPRPSDATLHDCGYQARIYECFGAAPFHEARIPCAVVDMVPFHASVAEDQGADPQNSGLVLMVGRHAIYSMDNQMRFELASWRGVKQTTGKPCIPLAGPA